MTGRASRFLTLIGVFTMGAAAVSPRPAAQLAEQTAPRVRATRFANNPLITPATSASLGDDINNPTVIRVPSWIDKPLGRYYMYFAHHMGRFVRLAYADALEGPWRIYEPGVLKVEDTAFYRPQPDPPENLENFYTHVASPEIFVDDVQHRMVLWVHGFWTEGAVWPAGQAAARAWVNQHGYGQFTQSAVSRDGLRFDVQPAITRTSYLRVFPFDDGLYGMARLGLLLRSKDPLSTWETGANPFRDGPFAGRVRHVALLRRSQFLYVFFTAIGEAPERIMVATMSLEGDWRNWRVSPALELLKPEASYECPALPNAPSEAGDVKGPVQQLRDPGLFEENGRVFLYYAICGEQGIAGAELSFN